jgi:hypothetical protein
MITPNRLSPPNPMAIALSDELVLLQKETSQIKELNNTDHIYVARTSKGGT